MIPTHSLHLLTKMKSSLEIYHSTLECYNSSLSAFENHYLEKSAITLAGNMARLMDDLTIMSQSLGLLLATEVRQISDELHAALLVTYTEEIGDLAPVTLDELRNTLQDMWPDISPKTTPWPKTTKTGTRLSVVCPSDPGSEPE